MARSTRLLPKKSGEKSENKSAKPSSSKSAAPADDDVDKGKNIFDGDDAAPAQDMECSVLPLLPNYKNEIARLCNLLEGGRLPVVTVIGKYNHGKSQLLNELIGIEVFKVADKRQTVELEPFVHEGTCWLDAPGLDADVASEDDDKAWHGAWLESDIRLFVHAAKEGELDAKERYLLDELRANDQFTQQKTIFVLSQIDQLANDVEIEKVRSEISAQIPGMIIHGVSSVRYRQGREEDKKRLLEKSGMPVLHMALNEALADVKKARQHEIDLLIERLKQELEGLKKQKENILVSLRRKQESVMRYFEKGLSAAMAKASRQLEEV